MNALGVSGEVDEIRRLHRDPPTECEQTAWSVVEDGGEKVLLETAVVDCPDCEQRAYWASGVVACSHCQQRQRLIG
jgi:hypothetical protein